jgi:site-specific recombinase XerD
MAQKENSGRLPVIVRERQLVEHRHAMPTLIDNAGPAAQFAWEEFFYAVIRNPHTRRSYGRAIRQFVSWCESRPLNLNQVTPADLGRYLDGIPDSAASKKVYLAAIRHFFDILVQRHVVILNPTHSVRGDRHVAVEGKTPEITVEQARKLLASIDTAKLVGLRDKAILSVLVYTAARVGAVARLRIQDFYDIGDQYWLRFQEKGGKSREIPVRYDLQQLLQEYLGKRHESDASIIYSAGEETPLFLTAIRRTGQLSTRAMSANDTSRMVRRRMRDAGLPTRLTAHSCRVATITDLLSQGVSLADVQNLAGHAAPRTTRLYDRRGRRVTRNIVERISI